MAKKITMQDLIRRSSKAVCGITERQVIVKDRNLKQVRNVIKKSGSHFYVGSGPSIKKENEVVWFQRKGGF